MANCVACLRCGHKFAPQTDARKKKNNPCPRCGSTEQLELVGVPAPEPEPAPPRAAAPQARPEPLAGTEIAPDSTVQTTDDAYPEEDDRDLYEPAPGRRTFDVDVVRRSDESSRGPGQPIMALAAILLVFLVGGYFAWRHFHSGEQVADNPQGEGAAAAAVEPANPPDNPGPAEPAEPKPALPSEPDLPAPKPGPAGVGPPQDPFSGFPSATGQGPAIGSPAEPVSPTPVFPEPVPGATTPDPTPAIDSGTGPNLGGTPELGMTPSPGGLEPAPPISPGPATTEPPVAGPVGQTPVESSMPPPANTPPDVKPVEASAPPVKIARTLEEAEKAIVKFELPLGIGDLTEYGAGFLVDPRGWVATNHHVAAAITTDARVQTAGGQELKVEGILADSSSHDLALVKLSSPPSDMMVLDIQYDGTPALGEQVYAFGHPYQADFSLSNGVVGRVLTTAQMQASAHDLVFKKIGAPADMVWIQHDAKISPGNSGGPLIDQQGRVLGVNTFVNVKAEFGYASHVRYLRELVATATGDVTPPPPPREFVRTTISGDRIKSLFATADGFAWRPRTAEQYDQLAELARQLTLAKHALAVSGTRPGSPPAVLQGVARLADQAFAAIEKAPWGPEQLSAFNNFAADQIDQVGHGVVMNGVVWQIINNPQKPNLVVMALPGSQKPVVVQLASPVPDLTPGSRWLIFGFVSPSSMPVKVTGESEPHRTQLVLVHYMTRVK